MPKGYSICGFFGHKIYYFIPVILILLITGAFAQSDLEGTVQQMSDDAAQEFLQPLADAFGANLNTGLINKAPAAKIMGFDFKFGLVFMGAFIDKDAQIFQLLGNYRFQEAEARDLAQSINGFNQLPQEQQDAIVQAITETDIESEISGPTVFGSEDDNLVVTTKPTEISANNTQYTIASQTFTYQDIQGLLNKPGLFPTAAPQVTVGTIYGTQATLRYLPSIKLSEDIGNLDYFGFGISHNPGVWFANPLPVDLSLSFFRQKLTIGDIVDATATAYGLGVSKTFSGVVASVTPYAAYMREKSKMKITYTYQITPNYEEKIDFELEGANKNRLILGFNLNLLGLNLFADYNISKVNTFNLSLAYGF